MCNGKKVDFAVRLAAMPGRHGGAQIHKVKKPVAPSFDILPRQEFCGERELPAVPIPGPKGSHGCPQPPQKTPTIDLVIETCLAAAVAHVLTTILLVVHFTQ